jgi:hypothetical protein
MLKGFEYMARYNTSYLQSYPDQPSPWVPDVIQRLDRTGRWFTKAVNPGYEADQSRVTRGNFQTRPVYEQAAAHFTVRMGLTTEALWTVRSRDLAIDRWGYEPNGWSLDHPGFGAVTFRRPPLAAGDPVSGFANGVPQFKLPAAPAAIEAEDFDHFPGSGQGRTYQDLTPANSGGQYRAGELVDIEAAPGGHAVADIGAGEWLSYTLHAPAAGNYALTVRYAAANGNGRIRFAFGGEDKTGDIALPFGGSHSTGMSDWKDFVVDTVALSAGVQNMRLFAGGADNAYKLDRITVAAPGQQVSIRSSGGLARGTVNGNRFTLDMPMSFTGSLRMALFDPNGARVREFRHARRAGEPAPSIDLTGVPPGRYLVEISRESEAGAAPRTLLRTIVKQ